MNSLKFVGYPLKNVIKDSWKSMKIVVNTPGKTFEILLESPGI
jgi:hypothetical protein